MINFIKQNHNEIINLKNEFNKLSKHKWNELTILNEFLVQVGHLATFEIDEKGVNKARNITDLSNEVIDNIMQIVLLIDKLNIDLNDLELTQTKESSVVHIIYVLGGLTETMLEKHEYRYMKDRKNLNEFILQSINRLITIFNNFADKNNINLEKTYKNFLKESYDFLMFKLGKIRV